MSEHKPDGSAIFFSRLKLGRLGPGSDMYHAFKFEWHALPNEESALVAFENLSGTSLYVSWTGNKETKLWMPYKEQSNGQRNLLGRTLKDRFAPRSRIKKNPARVLAETNHA